MPVHDWTRVHAEIFHAFHISWIATLMHPLNNGLLPQGYYAMAEQIASRVRRPTRRGRHLAIRHINGHAVVALLEIVAPLNKDRRAHVRVFAKRVVRSLESGVHVLLVDLLPPTSHAPDGIHGAVWGDFDRTPYVPPPDGPLTLASYTWNGSEPEAFIEPAIESRWAAVAISV